jgi:hypothetical protein
MARNSTEVVFNEHYFEKVLRQPAVEALTDAAGDRALAAAKAGAPVDTGEYRDELHIEHHEGRFRRTTQVVGGDPKTMIIESKTGNLARAIKAAKS